MVFDDVRCRVEGGKVVEGGDTVEYSVMYSLDRSRHICKLFQTD